MNHFAKKVILFLLLPSLCSCTTIFAGFSKFFSSAEVNDEEKKVELKENVQQKKWQANLPEAVVEGKKEGKKPFLCEEADSALFNNVGIEALPFLKPLFIDIDGDGIPELIAGSKYGDLRLYRKTVKNGKQRWEYVNGYFKGINTGFFSAPAAADIDGDGKIEVAVGIGGFSKESGKVVFYKNYGTVSKPEWKELEVTPVINAGNDATPAFLDMNGDGKPDLIVGNSIGKLSLYINNSADGKVEFTEVRNAFKNFKFGMYANISVTKFNKRQFIVIGNDSGKLFLLERRLNNAVKKWNLTKLAVSVKNFASPSFLVNKGNIDLVVSDSSGKLSYFKSSNLKKWGYFKSEFKNKVHSGFACSPSVASIEGKDYLIIGNISGELKLYKFKLYENMPFSEMRGFFKGIRLKGFSKAVITDWNNKMILVAGQQDGTLKAYENKKSFAKPEWREIKNFFSGIKVSGHSAPAVFDIDGDGKWELIVGDYKGDIHFYRIVEVRNKLPVWEKNDLSPEISVKNYAVPSLFKYNGEVFLVAGQQDGKAKVFKKESNGDNSVSFRDYGLLKGVEVKSHNSPHVYHENGKFIFTVGDYDGNLKLFTCPDFMERSLTTALSN